MREALIIIALAVLAQTTGIVTIVAGWPVPVSADGNWRMTDGGRVVEYHLLVLTVGDTVVKF